MDNDLVEASELSDSLL